MSGTLVHVMVKFWLVRVKNCDVLVMIELKRHKYGVSSVSSKCALTVTSFNTCLIFIDVMICHMRVASHAKVKNNVFVCISVDSDTLESEINMMRLCIHRRLCVPRSILNEFYMGWRHRCKNGKRYKTHGSDFIARVITHRILSSKSCHTACKNFKIAFVCVIRSVVVCLGYEMDR